MAGVDDDELEGTIDRLQAQTSRRAVTGLLRTRRDLWSAAVVDRLYERVVRIARADVAQAERLATAAAWIAARIADDGARAVSLRAGGHVLFMRCRYGESLDRYKAALDLFRTLDRRLDVGRTLSGALLALLSIGRYDEAYAWGQEAREIFERHGDRLRLARLDSNIGNILYRQERFPEALALYERAHRELARIGQPTDVAAVLINMVVCCTSLNDFQKALTIYNEARAYCVAHDMPLLVVQADYNIAYLHYLRGEYTRALELYRDVERQSDQAGDPYHRGLCDLDRAEIYLELNLAEESADLGGRALARFEKLGTTYETARAVTNVGLAASQKGASARALELFGQARDLFTAEGNQVWLALVDFYEAVVRYRDGQYGEAERLVEHALHLFADAAVPGKVALCELLLARLKLDTGDSATAERVCRAAVEKARGLQSPILNYHAAFALGLIREAQHDLADASASFEQARASLEQLRGQLQADDLKVAFLEDKQALYESLVSICLASGVDDRRAETAFGYIEQAKSRSLADLIAFRASALAPRTAGEPGDDVRDVRQQLTWHYRQIELEELKRERRSAQRLTMLRQRALGLERQVLASLNAIARTDEEFASLHSARPVPLEEIREVLGDGTVLLEYYEARGWIYACVLGRDRLDVLRVAPAPAVKQRWRLLQFQLSRTGVKHDAGQATHGAAATRAHLAELYALLVAPVRSRLAAGHVVVVPHGVLHYVPFHALWDGARFLVDDLTISYAPSASVYRLCCAKQPHPDGPALVMGVPDVRAPFITEEVQAVSASISCAKVFLGDDATAARLSTYGPASRLIHLAAHGAFRRDNPLLSSIRLGGGPLSVIDLYQLRLSAELVTLSGCGTGLNAVVGGDELLGLVRGLLYAGARSVMLTLWDAHDASTAEFMASFYSHLQSGAPKARAVQRAMAEIRARYPHPFHWAPFILVGQVEP